MNALLEISDVSVRYHKNTVVDHIGFDLAEGEIGCLLGPSGCGKTSLLRAIAGFEPIVSGHIKLDDRILSTPGTILAPEKRRVGMVFQDLALFPHLNIEKNVAFGLRMLSRSKQQARVAELLELVNLQGFNKRYPHQLSGGQQQRVALIRAIAPHPALLLLDEPFSSLDTELRVLLAKEVRDILKRDGITALMVTHDQVEAFAMGDKIGVIHDGKLLQWDSSYTIYHKPATPFVAEFIGSGVTLDACIVDNETIESAIGRINVNVPTNCVRKCAQKACSPGCEIKVLVRPDDIIHDDDSEIQLEIIDKSFRGAEFLYTLKVDERQHILCLVHSHHNHGIGEQIGIRLDFQHLPIFSLEQIKRNQRV